MHFFLCLLCITNITGKSNIIEIYIVKKLYAKSKYNHFDDNSDLMSIYFISSDIASHMRTTK